MIHIVTCLKFISSYKNLALVSHRYILYGWPLTANNITDYSKQY